MHYFVTKLALALALLFSSSEGLQKAPEISGKTPEGKEVKLSELKGKIVLVDFWASWCGPCRRENPNVVEAYRKYRKSKFNGARGFEVFSVSLDRNQESWTKAIDLDHLNWKHHVWDQDQRISRAYGVRSIPSAFLINGRGEIVASGNALRGIGLHIEIEKLMD
ncbi:MAG: TlpA family protein disulfide reductase [Bacteroidetes bacterium]|nr:MAG: TlpA family protein disulfide reductase [Bacteroidota bacterium]